VCRGQRASQTEHLPWLVLQQREHALPGEAFQHRTGTAVAVHDVDQLRGDAVSVLRHSGSDVSR